MYEKEKKERRLPVGTIVQDKDYPEDKGIIIEVGEDSLRSAYRVYAISGYKECINKNTTGWYDKEYIESCNVLVIGSGKRKEARREKEERCLSMIYRCDRINKEAGYHRLVRHGDSYKIKEKKVCYF